MSVEELNGSELGTKDYWDKSYNCEIKNYKSHGDVGEVWFDEDSQIRVINWMLKNEISHESQFADLGCGNGMMLIELSREGFHNLTGIDYSENAIELSKEIARDQKIDINYKLVDLLSAASVEEKLGGQQFDIIHDKGTYDAISLHPNNPTEKRNAYIDNMYRICAEDGLLIVSSCNWTDEELCISLSKRFVKHKTIPTPTFKFGGKVGSVLTQIVFKRL